MTPSQPPCRATRMMQRTGVDPAIVGDLIEEYSRGRSSLWYWMQAFGALMTKTVPTLSPDMARFRWLAALPLAILAVRAVSRMALFFTRDFSHLQVSVPIASFFMAAAFLSTGVLVAPEQKDAVARIAFGVVLFLSAAVMLASVLVGVCGLLGGAAAYTLQRAAWKRGQTV